MLASPVDLHGFEEPPVVKVIMNSLYSSFSSFLFLVVVFFASCVCHPSIVTKVGSVLNSSEKWRGKRERQKDRHRQTDSVCERERERRMTERKEADKTKRGGDRKRLNHLSETPLSFPLWIEELNS